MDEAAPRFWIELDGDRLRLMEQSEFVTGGAAVDSFQDLAELEGYVRESEECAREERAALERWKAECAIDGFGYI